MPSLVSKAKKIPPGPKGWPIFGVISEIWRDPFRFLEEVVRKYGPIASFRVGPDLFVLLSHPDYYQFVLQHPQKFAKQTRAYRFLRPLLGEGLLTSEGGAWLRQRRISQPSFHRQRIAGFANLMVQATQEMLDSWRNYERRDETFDLSSEMMKLTYRIVSGALFSSSVGEGSEAIGQSLREVLHDVERRAHSVFSLPLSFPSPRNRRVRRALATIQTTAASLIEGRRRNPGSEEDLLSMLMEARDEETGAALSDAQLLDEVVTILMAGHETTANALSWTWYLLDRNPEIAGRLKAELDQALDGKAPTFEDFPKLQYAGQIIEESMRLYPPVWWLDRRAMEDTEIGGFAVPKNSIVVVSPFLLHRHPDYWEDPDRFDPERFEPEKSDARHPFSYLPFSAGPRQCIGNNFALLEARLILACVAQRYQLRFVPEHPIEMDPSIVLRPKYGLKASLKNQPPPGLIRGIR